jgi:ATP phosphoribosyltransferase regulatory subunit
MTPASDTATDNGTDPAAGLLPAGFRDVLPPQAAWEAEVARRLLEQFAGHGYARVDPPLVEFEPTLTAGPGEALASETLRLMDPISQRMLGLRTDTTLQIARIAATRLEGAPRPLRLAYHSQVLRVRGTQTRPERQFGQAGVELIGSDALAADVEVALLAAESLTALGVKHLSLDINHPRLAAAACDGLGLAGDKARRAKAALSHKDAAGLAALGGAAAKTLGALLEASGPAEDAMPAIKRLDLPKAAADMIASLGQLVQAIRKAAPELALTVDPGEFRGFEYHTGVCFSLFARGVRGELGAGGRYLTERGEAATGFTLYLPSLMKALPEAAEKPLVFLPAGTAPEAARKLRADGWAAVQGLAAAKDDRREAKRLGCTHLLVNGGVQLVGAGK